MQTIFYKNRFVTGKILKIDNVNFISGEIHSNIIYINSNAYFNLCLWKELPLCILIDESSLFSHFVSYCISNEIAIALVSKDEILSIEGKNVTIDFENNIIGTKKYNYIDSSMNNTNYNLVKTKNEVPIKLFATIKNIANAIYAKHIGIKSAGLISTEFFQSIDSLNSCKQSLNSICECFTDGISSIRLFDYDDNKSSFIRNHKLERGIRSYEFEKIKQIIDTQINACNYLSKKYSIEIVIPFVTNIQDIFIVKSKIEEYNSNISLCVMLENPSSYLSVKEFNEYVNSFSIGTNDLLQYFFAFDRNSVNGTNYINPYTKSLLKFLSLYPSDLISKTRICGQLPIYPYMLQVLIQLGFRNFSIPSPMIPMIFRKIENMIIDKDFKMKLKSLTSDYDLRKYIFKNMIK